jgi:serine/threonine-protein kinase
MKRDKNEEALARALEALDIAKKRYPDGHPKIAICLTQVARCRLALNEPEKAKPLYTEALAILNKTLGEDDPETLEVRNEVIKFGPRLSPAKSSAARGPKK